MKVVLLAGGLGTRMREETELRPKPMVEIGGRPVLWHIMKNFSHYGHKDFVILAGYKAQMIKSYFVNYFSNNLDISLTLGDPDSLRYHGSHDESDWKVTVVNTGENTPTGGRIAKAKKYIGDEPFFCTYGDGIANVDLSSLEEAHAKHAGFATLTGTRAAGRFGVLAISSAGLVTDFKEKPELSDLVNIGFFLFEAEVFSHLREDSTLEGEPLRSIASSGNLGFYEHTGFWQPMDTLREYQSLNSMWESGNAPWITWRSP